MGVKRVLIVDWDVHFGNGTQRIIEDDPEGLKLISIHRYEHGCFWPELPDAAAKHPHPNTINVPLDELAYGDVEYVAFLNHLVLPVVAQWDPELILVSCGFDAALGDREGEMEVSPLGFGYMAGILASLGIPLCVLLEGGYFIDSVAKGGLFTLNALIDRRPPINYTDNFACISPRSSFLRTLFSTAACVQSGSDYKFSVFSEWLTVLNTLRGRRGLSAINAPDAVDYQGNRNVTYPYKMINLYPPRAKGVEQGFSDRLKRILTRHEESLAEWREGRTRLVLRKVGQPNVLELQRENPPQRWKLVVSNRHGLHFLFFFILFPLTQQYDIEVEGTNEARGAESPLRLSGLPREMDVLCRLLHPLDEANAGYQMEDWDTLESIYDSFDVLRGLAYFD